MLTCVPNPTPHILYILYSSKTETIIHILPLIISKLLLFQNSFDVLKREIRSEFENLHRFLDEEECKDLERLQRERQKQVKQLKEREKKIAAQATDLETAIYVLNKKLTEEDHPKLLRVRKRRH